MPLCSRGYSLTVLSPFLDRALRLAEDMEAHLRQCPACQSVQTTLQKLEEEIVRQEHEQRQTILLEIFDTLRQKRFLWEVGWPGLWVGVNAAGVLETGDRGLHFFLEYNWFGQMHLYVKEEHFPWSVLVQRGRLQLRLCPGQNKRLIDADNLILQDAGTPLVSATVYVPVSARDHSLTRKYHSLRLVSQTFLQHFFQPRPGHPLTLAWPRVKATLDPRSVGLYLCHLRERQPYEKTAALFRLTPSRVARLIIAVRQRLLDQIPGQK